MSKEGFDFFLYSPAPFLRCCSPDMKNDVSYFAKTTVLTIDPRSPEPAAIAAAADMLQSGGLVAFPTETVYGLGANALDEDAVGRIFAAKSRPLSDPLIVHISALEELPQVARNMPDAAWLLAEKFWPGPLTLVLDRHHSIARNVAATQSTVAVRMPRHEVARQLISCAGVPVAAPSANLFSRPSPTTAEHVVNDLKDRVDIILDAGPCEIGLESTVVDLTQSLPVLLRPGGITLEALRSVLPSLHIRETQVTDDTPFAGSASPGMLRKHYSPNAEFLLYSGSSEACINRMRDRACALLSEGKRVGIMAPNEDQACFDGIQVVIETIGSELELVQIGQALFAAMRRIDAQGVDVILARTVGNQEGLGLAIWDRLIRAADGKIVFQEETRQES